MCLVSDFSCCRILLKFHKKIRFYWKYKWVVSEEKGCFSSGVLVEELRLVRL